MTPFFTLSFADLGPQKEKEEAAVLVSETTESCNLDQVTANHIRSVLKMTNGRVEGEKGGRIFILDLLRADASPVKNKDATP